MIIKENKYERITRVSDLKTGDVVTVIRLDTGEIEVDAVVSSAGITCFNYKPASGHLMLVQDMNYFVILRKKGASLYKEISPKDVKTKDTLIIVDLSTGVIRSGAHVDAYNGGGCFNYSHPSVDNGREYAACVITDMHPYVKIYRKN